MCPSPIRISLGTVQYSTVQYSTVQYSTVQYSTVQYSNEKLLLCPAARFYTADQFIIASPKQGPDVAGAVGVVFAVLIVIGEKIFVTHQKIFHAHVVLQPGWLWWSTS